MKNLEAATATLSRQLTIMLSPKDVPTVYKKQHLYGNSSEESLRKSQDVIKELSLYDKLNSKPDNGTDKEDDSPSQETGTIGWNVKVK